MFIARNIKLNRCCLRLNKSFSNKNSDQDRFTDFGYQKVHVDEKQDKVNSIFSAVADKYDVMNDVMSLGVHRLWKDCFISDIGLLGPSKTYQDNNIIETPPQALDVAGGTGDIAFRLLDKHHQNNSLLNYNQLKVNVMDISEPMLKEGEKRAKELGFTDQQIEFKVGNAEELPYNDNTFDVYTISFGLRNVPRKELALKEAYRVLKKGGRIMILEFSKVENQPLSEIYKFYNMNIIPAMGQAISGDSQSYRYLAESIDNFHDQQTLLNMIKDAGFKYGIVAIHSGFKL